MSCTPSRERKDPLNLVEFTKTILLISWSQNIIQAMLARLAKSQNRWVSGHFNHLKYFYSDLERR